MDSRGAAEGTKCWPNLLSADPQGADGWRARREAVEAHIDTRSAAVPLGLKEPTVRKYTCMRILPHVKIGTRVLFRPSELERWANERRVPALGDQS